MRRRTKRVKTVKPARVSYPLSLPESLDADVEAAAEKLDLSKQDAARQALKLGLPLLLAALGVSASSQEKPETAAAAA